MSPLTSPLVRANLRRIAFPLAILIIVVSLLAGVAAVWYARTLPDRGGAQQTMLLGQSRLAPGSAAGLRVLVRELNSEQPIANAQVQVSLRPKSGGAMQTLYSGRTGPHGTADVQFRVPDNAPTDAELIVRAASRAGRDEIVKPIQVVRKVKLFLTSDKPVYQPGQVIHIRGLALNALDLKPAAGAEVSLIVEDPKGNKVFRTAPIASDYGIVAADFALAEEVNQGRYKIIAELGETKSEKTVTVKWYVLPKFRIEVTTDKPFYLSGEVVKGRVQADYFFGKPVAGGAVKIAGAAYDVQRRQIVEIQGQTDANGGFDFALDVPAYLVGGAAGQETATFYLETTVVDKAGHAEETTRDLPVARQPLLLDAVPESGQLRPGVENIIYIMASYPDGAPAQAALRVIYTDAAQMAQTGAHGVAEVRFTPTAGAARLEVSAQDATGRTATKTLNLEADRGPAQVLLRPDRPTYRVGDTMHLDAFVTSAARTVYLDIVKERQTLSTRAGQATDGRASFAVDLTPDLFGALELHAYTVGRDGTIVRDTRIVVVNAPVDVQVTLQADKESYRPGEVARLAFQLSRQGQPTAGALGVAIVDESVFSVEEQDPGFARLYFLLEAELLQPRYQIKDTLAPELLNPPIAVGATAAPTPDPQRDSQAQAALARPPGSDFTLRVNSWPEKLASLKRQQQAAFRTVANGLLIGFGTALLAVAAIVVATLKRRDLLRSTRRAFLLTLLILVIASWLIVPLVGAILYFLSASLGGAMLIVLLALSWLTGLVALGVCAILQRDQAVGLVVLLLASLVGLLILLPWITVVQPIVAEQGVLVFVGIASIIAVAALYLLGLGLRRAGQLVGGLSAIGLSAVALPALVALTFAPLFSRVTGTGDMRFLLGAGAPQPAAFDRAVVQTVVVEKAMEKVVQRAPEPTKAPAAASPAAAQEPPRLRQYFPETLYWNPQAISDAAGRVTLDVSLADSITTWRVSAQASTKGGALGGSTTGLRVFQDFFVDLDLPVALTQNDEIAAPVSVFNYLAQKQEVRLELKQENWFDLLDQPTKTLTIGPNDVTAVYFRIRAREFGRQRLTVTAWGAQMSDAVARELRVLPDGKEVRRTTSDWLRDGTAGAVRIPANAIPGATKIEVKVYPGLLSQVVEGLDGLLRMPFG